MGDRSVRQVRSQKGDGKGLGLRLTRVSGGARGPARQGQVIWTRDLGGGGLAWSEDSWKEVLL